MSGCIHDPRGDLLGNCYQCYPERAPKKILWYQTPTIGRKWHLLDSKCVNVRAVWGNNEYMEKAHAAAKAKAISPIKTPAWSKVPLPDTAIGRICKNCFKKVNI